MLNELTLDKVKSENGLTLDKVKNEETNETYYEFTKERIIKWIW